MKAWKAMSLKGSTIFLLIEYEGRTGGCIPEVLGIRNEHSKVLFFFFIEINFHQWTLNGKLLHENLNSAFKKKCFPQPWDREKIQKPSDRFQGNGPYCKIPTKNQPSRVLHMAWELIAI